jgi:hypothetical protein
VTVPKHRLPDGPMIPELAYEIIRDELMFDGNARLNLATFVTTWMEPQAEKLMAETFDKNMIDKDEYPQTAELEMRCVNMLSRLWNSPSEDVATGCSTTGSSEAAMLGGLALKRRWQQGPRRNFPGRPEAVAYAPGEAILPGARRILRGLLPLRSGSGPYCRAQREHKEGLSWLKMENSGTRNSTYRNMPPPAAPVWMESWDGLVTRRCATAIR